MLEKDYKQEQTPLLRAMQKYIDGGAAAYHTPGHKQGKGIPAKMRRLITDTGLRMEVSLMEELDDLHAPAACIKEAQTLAAELYGADESFFVINGTTGAIHAMLLGTLQPGDKVLLPRNVHRSVTGGLVLSGAVPVYIQPEADEILGIAMPLTAAAVAQVIEQTPEAKAVLLVYPTYYGVAADIKAITDLAHQHDMLLLVDEAHGPHLKFSDQLPMQALDAGADVVAQSTHKLVGAMTQCSMLHIRYGRLDVSRMHEMLSLLQSTSPNYLLLASLDTAREQLAVDGARLIGAAVELANWLRDRINEIEGLYCFGRQAMAAHPEWGLDYTKLTVTVTGLGISGTEAEKILRWDYQIQSELSDSRNVLFIISYADGRPEAELLLNALRGLAEQCRKAVKHRSLVDTMAVCPLKPEAAFTPRAAVNKRHYIGEFKTSAGQICGESIMFYPPGIPVICPGEILTQDIIDYCMIMKSQGLKVVGPEDTDLLKINLLKK